MARWLRVALALLVLAAVAHCLATQLLWPLWVRLVVAYERKRDCDEYTGRTEAIVEACLTLRERHPLVHAWRAMPPLVLVTWYYAAVLVLVALALLSQLAFYVQWRMHMAREAHLLEQYEAQITRERAHKQRRVCFLIPERDELINQ